MPLKRHRIWTLSLRRAAGLVAATVTAAAACSGPGAAATIASSLRQARWNAAFSGVLLLVVVLRAMRHRCRWTPVVVVAVVMAVHPAWTISVYTGDCGFMARDASYAASFVPAVVVLMSFVKWRIEPRTRKE